MHGISYTFLLEVAQDNDSSRYSSTEFFHLATSNKEKVNNAEEEDPQLEKDREAFLAQLKKDWAE